MDEESYLWQVARYIEKNPQRIGVVALEEDYPYSSASAHVLNTPDEILNEQLFDDKSRSDYIAFLKERPAEAEINIIRKSTKVGRPLGDNSFINKIGKLLGRQFLRTAPSKRVK